MCLVSWVEWVMCSVFGVEDVKVEQVLGLLLLIIMLDLVVLVWYGLNLGDVQEMVVIVIGGSVVGQLIEGDCCFDLVVCLFELQC